MPGDLSPQEVQTHLEALLASPSFRRSRRMRQFLRYVVEETVAGRAQRIKAYNIAVEAFGLPSDFDPQTNPLVRMQARKLRQVLGEYYAGIGKDSGLRIAIPKGGYRPKFYTAGQETHDAKDFEPLREEAIANAKPSIAVMPLTNITKDQAQEYFADGLTEELTAELARYQEFKVIASQSTMRFKGQEINPKQAGKDLGARFLLTGSIRKDKKSIKVAISLIDALTNSQAWGESYKRDLTVLDLIALQEDIAQKTVGVLADQFGLISRLLSRESRKKAPASMEVYDAVFSFYHYETLLTPQAFKKALSALQQAVKIDPDYGLAWAMLGHLYADNHALGFVEMDAPLEKAMNFAQKGVALSPDNQFAQDAMTLVHFHQGDKEHFLRHLEETISLNPNAPYIIGVAGWHLSLFGEWERGLALLQQGMKLNPFYPTWFHLAPYMDFYRRGDYESALAEALAFNYTGLFWDPLMRAAALGQMGRTGDAQKAVKQLLKIEPGFTESGIELIRGYVKVDELIGKLVEGLQKAGLPEIR
jgi:adenylate cyclase